MLHLSEDTNGLCDLLSMRRYGDLVRLDESENILGLNRVAAASQSLTVMAALPSAVTLITASVCWRMTGKNRAQTSGSPVGAPVSGIRAWRWRIAGLASAAATGGTAISCGVIGSASDMVGVWAEPATAQLMITLLINSRPAKRH